MISSAECMAWFAVFIIKSVGIVTVNLLSIILFIKNRSLRTRAMYLVINLTVADMFVGGTFDTIYTLKEFGCEILNFSFTTAWEFDYIMSFVFWWFPLTSLTNIAVISLDRAHATFRPFSHRGIKKWVYWVTITGVWVLTAIISTACFLILQFKILSPVTYYYFWQSYCCLCLLVICVSYASIAVKFLCGAHPQHHGAVGRQRKLTVTLFIMTILSLLMWLPYAILIFVRLTTYSMESLSLVQQTRWYISSCLLLYANSLVNPIVYTIRMPEFRKALLVLFKRGQRQNADIPLHAR